MASPIIRKKKIIQHRSGKMRTQPQTIIRKLEENNRRLGKEKILQVADDEG